MELAEVVVEGEMDPVPVPLPVGVPVGVGLAVGGGVAELVRELLPVLEAEAPALRGAVEDAVAVELLEMVVLGVKEVVPVQEDVGEPVGVRVGVFGGVALLEKETPAVFDAETPVTAGDAVTVKLKESVEEGALADVLVSV